MDGRERAAPPRPRGQRRRPRVAAASSRARPPRTSAPMASASPRVFPWITPPGPARRELRRARSSTSRTARGASRRSCRCCCSSSVWGCITTFRPRGRPAPPRCGSRSSAMLAIPGAILFYGYIAYRYTSEVVPALALAGAVGLHRPGPAPRGPAAALAAGRVHRGRASSPLFGFVANLAVALLHQPDQQPRTSSATTSGSRRRSATARPASRSTTWCTPVPRSPHEGEADEIQIVGDCEARLRRHRRAAVAVDAREIRELGWDLDLSAPAPRTARRAHRDHPRHAGRLPGRRRRAAHRGRHVPRHLRHRRRRSSGAGPAPPGERASCACGWCPTSSSMQYVLVDIDNPERGLVDIENSLPTPDWFRQQLIFHTDSTSRRRSTACGMTPVAGRPARVLRAPAARLPPPEAG